MKTLIPVATKPERFFVRIAPFEFERFEVRVRRVKRHRPFLIGVSYRKVNVHRVLKQFKTIPGPPDGVHRTKILLPSPSLQGHGLMCSRLGARPVHDPAALSSGRFHPTAPNFFSTEAREPQQIAPLSHK
jgi:hypothetical protein